MSVYYLENPKYLKQSIDSILNQTVPAKQIVIIEDGKVTKEIEEILKEYKQKFPQIIEIHSYEENSGLGTSLRNGIEFCKYEYIARMDTDDISVINRFEKQIEYVKQFPDTDILGGQIEEYDETMNEKISIRKVPIDNEQIKKKLKWICAFNHSTVMFKKSKVLSAGNYNETKLEDYDLWVRMATNNMVMHNLPIILVKNRTGTSMYKKRSGFKYVKRIFELENILLKYKYINILEYLLNITARTIVALCPISIKKYVYPKLIRKL